MQAFSARMASQEGRVKPSKRKPVGDDRTGPGMAAEYRLKHNGEGLIQLSRYLRIGAGLRPFKFDVPGKRERTIARKIEARA